PLSPEEAEALSRSLLGPDDAERARAIAREAGYSPFFIHELVRSLRERRGDSLDAGSELRLDAGLAARLARLPEDARRPLAVVPAAGRPLPRAIAALAAELGPGRSHDVLSALRAGRLLRTRGSRENEELETFHDRIREAAVAQMTPASLAEHHLSIARV